MAANPIVTRVRQRWRRHVGEPFEERVRAPLRRWRNADRVYRPLFVAGVGGSGTSLLAVLLAQRFECAGIIYENAHQVARDSFLWGPLSHFRTVDEYLEGLAPRPDWSLEAARADLLDLYRRHAIAPASWIVDKGPDVHLMRAAFLARVFPDAPFVLIFRDPLSQVEGLRRKWRMFGDAPLEDSLRFWSETHEAFLGAAKDLEGRRIAVEYEELVDAPDEKLRAIGERLGLRPGTQAVRIPDRPNSEGMGIRNVRRNRVEVSRDATARALERLGAEEARVIHTALGPLHEELRGLSWKV